jgi:F-box protein 18 (helicase)
MQLTAEQLAVIDTNEDLVINAVAGSGKTTTLIEYARSRPANSKILYLAFNKTVKTEAIQKFEKAGLNNVKVETAHSLAFDHIIKFSRFKMVPGYKSYEWCDILAIKSGDWLTDFIIGSHVNKFISYFCNGTVDKIEKLNYASVITDPAAQKFVNNFYALIEKLTRKALAKMDKAEIGVTHDFYLKKFQLGNPALEYDYILFDEGQDASGAMLDVFLKQKAIKVIVGDAHQQIYGWRYAINSLQRVNFPVHNLSNSFRFDDEIALVANKVLEWKKHLHLPPATKIVGAGQRSDILTKATLGRTNLSLLVNAISRWQHGEVKKIFFEGNINSYTFADEGASLYDVLNLYNGKPDKIKDKLIASMNSMRDLDDYIKKTEDNSLAVIAEVVKEFGNRLPALISELKSNHTVKKEEADMIFSTVHRCKGMEYDEVTLLNDFINEGKLKKYIEQSGSDKIDEGNKDRLSEEVNILYVAVTRTKSNLIIPPDINPLKSVKVAQAPPLLFSNPYRKFSLDEEPGSYLRTKYDRSMSPKSNRGKKWTDEEEHLLGELYKQGETLEEIAKRLQRGRNGVRIKLMDLGLMDESGEL